MVHGEQPLSAAGSTGRRARRTLQGFHSSPGPLFLLSFFPYFIPFPSFSFPAASRSTSLRLGHEIGLRMPSARCGRPSFFTRFVFDPFGRWKVRRAPEERPEPTEGAVNPRGAAPRETRPQMLLRLRIQRTFPAARQRSRDRAKGGNRGRSSAEEFQGFHLCHAERSSPRTLRPRAVTGLMPTPEDPLLRDPCGTHSRRRELPERKSSDALGSHHRVKSAHHKRHQNTRAREWSAGGSCLLFPWRHRDRRTHRTGWIRA